MIRLKAFICTQFDQDYIKSHNLLMTKKGQVKKTSLEIF
jgi:hypothetical protein